MRADMILLERNLFEIDPLEYVKVGVRKVWVDGEEVRE
jgi:predicted amidohydrolase YtcJ